MADKTFVIMKITSQDMEKLSELEESLKQLKSGEVKDVKREPIGFGIEVIKLGVLINEKEEGALEKLKKEVSEIGLVDSMEVEGMTLI